MNAADSQTIDDLRIRGFQEHHGMDLDNTTKLSELSHDTWQSLGVLPEKMWMTDSFLEDAFDSFIIDIRDDGSLRKNPTGAVLYNPSPTPQNDHDNHPDTLRLHSLRIVDPNTSQMVEWSPKTKTWTGRLSTTGRLRNQEALGSVNSWHAGNRTRTTLDADKAIAFALQSLRSPRIILETFEGEIIVGLENQFGEKDICYHDLATGIWLCGLSMVSADMPWLDLSILEKVVAAPNSRLGCYVIEGMLYGLVLA